jgi:segregation and condensation protein B
MSLDNLKTFVQPTVNDVTESSLGLFYIDVCGEKLPLITVLESLLFVADSPLDPAALARLLHCDTPVIEANLQTLAELYQDERRGLRLQERNGKFQLVTLPAVATIIEDFLNLEMTTELSGPALETLAVIAYRQPVTRMQVEAVRGVDSAGVLRSLVQRGLVEELGRLEVAGRPILYGITDLFMQHFGLMKLGELPPLESSEADTLWATTKLAELNGLSN